MTQHADKVAHQRKLLKLEEWRKGVKYILSECRTAGGVIEHKTVYNDDSEVIEYLRSKKKTKIIESPHTTEDLLYMMECADHDFERRLFLAASRK